MDKLEEIEISSQEFTKVQNWKIIKKFRVRGEDGKRKGYKYVLKCPNCGELKEVSTSTIYKNNIRCMKCEALKYVGQIYGTLEIIEFVGWSYKSNGQVQARMYKTRCINCGHIYEKKRLSDIKNERSCIYCNMINENPGLTMFYRSYKDGAKARNLQFNLSKEDFLSLVSSDCIYCGNPPITKEYITTHKSYYAANGIDRIDLSKGYTLDNCVPCCTKCNVMKLDYSKLDFLNHIKKIYYFNFVNKGSETIENTSNDGSEQSTSQANGGGNGGRPTSNIEDDDIVQSIQ